MESQQAEVDFLHNWSYNAQVGRHLPMDLKGPYVQHGIWMGPALCRVLRSKPVAQHHFLATPLEPPACKHTAADCLLDTA